MSYPVSIVIAHPAAIAAVVVRTTHQASAEAVAKAFGHIERAIADGRIEVGGPRIAMYRNLGATGTVEVSAGIQVAASFADFGAIRCLMTPAGRAAVVEQAGPPTGLSAAHTSILEWANEAGAELAGVSWELHYPAPTERVEVYHLLNIEPSVVDY